MPTDLDNLMKGQVLICCFTRGAEPPLTPPRLQICPFFYGECCKYSVGSFKEVYFRLQTLFTTVGNNRKSRGHNQRFTSTLAMHEKSKREQHEISRLLFFDRHLLQRKPKLLLGFACGAGGVH